MTEEETSLFAEACEYLRPHSCDCENITCVGANVKELVAKMWAVLMERQRRPPASSVLLVEKSKGDWIYVAANGHLTAGMSGYATQEEARAAAAAAIKRNNWPPQHRGAIP